MKLCDFPDELFRQISDDEEADLELPVLKAVVQISCKRGEQIVLQSWEYTNNKLVREIESEV